MLSIARSNLPFQNTRIATPGALIMLAGLGVFYWGFSNFGRKHGVFGFRNRIYDTVAQGKVSGQ